MVSWARSRGPIVLGLRDTPLGGAGQGTTLMGVRAHQSFDPAGQLIGPKVGPTTDDMIGILESCLSDVSLGADPFAGSSNQDAMRAKVQDASAFCHDEPTDVTVTANFRS
jgi:hypothetical protein